MGGAVALEISLRQPFAYRGMILLAPMCKISDKIKPPRFVVFLIEWLAALLPERPWFPSKDVIDSAYRLPEIRSQARSCPWAYRCKPRLRTAVTLIRFCDYLERRLTNVSTPFLLCHGTADKVTDPEISKELFMKSTSADKTLKLYEGMWHSLLHEPKDKKEKVWNDMSEWVAERSRDHCTF